MSVVCNLLNLYFIVLVLRAVLSWFPPPRSGAMATVNEFLFAVTEPVIAPVRRFVPPMGGFDVSFIIVFLGLQVVQHAVLGC